MADRKSVPTYKRFLLWGKAAGRCQFKGCNRLVGEHGVTFDFGNFAEIAHIIGSSKGGPRGNENSEELQTEESNLMLLCEDCHKLIDRDTSIFTLALLRQWKVDHEERVEIQTSYADEIYKSTILMCSIKIGERFTPINIEAIRRAMRPKYPSDKKGILIEDRDFDKTKDAHEWQISARKIKQKIEKALEMGIDEVKIKHLSIFAIGPIPLLMYLGKCIGDTIPTDIYQSHRDIEDTSKTWEWKNEEPETDIDFIIKRLHHTEGGQKVAITLSISDTISADKYNTFIDDSFSHFDITVSIPSPHFLKCKKQLSFFSYEFRKLLNEVQAVYGRNCSIYLLPAVPVAVAVECGRVILPTKDPLIFVCDYSPLGFREVLQIN